MAKTIRVKLLILLLAITAATFGIFAFLVYFNMKITDETASEVGSVYMSEMMFQTQDHFESLLTLKSAESIHIARHPMLSGMKDPRESLIENATAFEFDYLAFYDDGGNYETLMGESAWYHDLAGFIADIKKGETVSTTGYLTKSGEKYLVFGVPAEYEMNNGNTSSVLLLGFGVEKLYDYIHVKNTDQSEYDTKLDIILTNGAYVLKQGDVDDTSYFEHILQYGSFSGTETEQGVYEIEKAMASGKSFSHTVTLEDITKHIYGAPIDNPSNWYFVLSMPQGAIDELLEEQNRIKLSGFGFAGVSIFLLFFIVFLIYLRMSHRQIKETEAARNEAEIANNAKSSFLSNMSHDIRTPMNAIAGFAVIAEESIKHGKDPEALDAIIKMKRSTDYLRSLIGDVLDMSKIESGKLALMPEPISLKQTADMIDMIAKVRAEMKDQKYEFSIHDIIHDPILCDQTRLSQILINLIGNAVKFTGNGGEIKFEVWQEPSPKGEGHVRTFFVVQDTGIGMSEEFVINIFESFSREESRVRKIEGTGLGLAISKKLIDMMGGSIEIESRVGEGSRFRLEIDFPTAEQFAEAGIDEGVSFTAEHIRVIMAEDNDFNYEIAQVLLESLGFEVCRAENGKEAAELYCASPGSFDLILMDLRMPVLNGYQASEMIRSFEADKELHVPIFALSADVFEEDIKKCREAGMDGHLSKPINMNELTGKLGRYLGK